MIIKRILFSLRAAVEVFRATRYTGCDAPLVTMTRDDYTALKDDRFGMMAERNLLYQVIDNLVAGGSPCTWCCERDECAHEGKGGSSPGCGLWDLFIGDTEGGQSPTSESDCEQSPRLASTGLVPEMADREDVNNDEPAAEAAES